MFGREVRIKEENRGKNGKSVFTLDYYKSSDKLKTRFRLYSSLMNGNNTVLHINTNMSSSSISPEEDRDTVIKLKNMCADDSLDFSMSPAARENSSGVLGRILNSSNQLPAYNILIFIPSGFFSSDIFKKYMNTYFIHSGIGFNADDYETIRSDFLKGLVTPEDFPGIFEYDLFDAFDFSHMRIISDRITRNDLEKTV